MADNTTLNAGSGGDTIATDDIAGVKHQLVKVEFGVLDTATPVSPTNPLPVDQTNTTVADGGTLPAKGVQVGGTDGTVFQVLSTDSAGRLNTNINGTVTTTGGLTDTQLRATAVPVSGTVTASGPLTDTQLRATAVPVSGTVTANLGTAAVTNAGTFAVQADTELPAAVALADGASNPTSPAVGSFGLLWNGTTWDRAKGDATNGAFVNVKSSVLPTGASTAAKQPALGTAGVASADVLSIQGVASMTAVKTDGSGVTQPISGNVTNAGTFAVQIASNSAVNVAQVAGTATDVNSGNKSAGTQRFVLATDQPALTNAWKVDPSAVTSPVSIATAPALVAGSALIGRTNLDPQTANGLTPFHLISAATTNLTNIKASAGQVYGWYIYNSNAAARKVVFHNTAGTPTAGAGVIFTLMIPPLSAANSPMDMGLAFSAGIAISTVTDLTDAGTTAVGLNDLNINIFYK